MMTDEEKAEVRERNAKEFLEVVEMAKKEEVNMLVMDETRLLSLLERLQLLQKGQNVLVDLIQAHGGLAEYH